MKSAEDLFKELKVHSVAEFFRKNQHMLGYSGKIRSLTTIVHELLTNSIDAHEESGTLPDIKIRIDRIAEEYYRVVCEDKGPGIPEEHLGIVFGKMLAGTKFHRNIQLRGQQGIGVSGVTMFCQLTTGKPIKVTTSTGNGKIVEAKIMIDVMKNEPVFVEKKIKEGNWHGTKIVVRAKGVSYTKGSQGPYEYIRRTALSNPHARIVFHDPHGNKFVFERVVQEVIHAPQEIKPHPLGLLPSDLLDIAAKTKAEKIRTMLMKELARISREKVEEIARISGVDLEKSPKDMTWEDAEAIIKAFKKIKFMAPPHKGLISIGSEYIEKALEHMLEPEFVKAITRSPKVYRGGVPFIVEVGIAYGGKAGRRSENGVKAEIMRYANRTPLLFDSSACAITQAIRSIDWKRYGLQDFDNSPITVFVNISSTFIPYSSVGKQAISLESEIYKEVRNALMEVCRSLKIYFSRRVRAKIEQKRLEIFKTYMPIVAKEAAMLAESNPVPDVSSLIKKMIKEVPINVD